MKTLNEQISRIKQIMNINEDENDMMALLQQDTEAFNQEADEDLTVEEYSEISCQVLSGPDEVPEISPEMAGKIDQEGKGKLSQIVQAMKKATPEQLVEEKRKIKQAMASKNKGEMSEQGVLATTMIFGVSLGWALFLAISAYILGHIIYELLKNSFRRNPMRSRRGNCTDPIL
jgi:hypothetical protein